MSEETKKAEEQKEESEKEQCKPPSINIVVTEGIGMGEKTK